MSMPYAYCPNLANSIRVLPTLIRVLRISSPNSYAYNLFHTRMLRVTFSHYAYHQRPIHVQNAISFSHTRKTSPHTRTNISYAYCLVPYAYDQRPELSDLQWLLCYEAYPIQPSTVQFSHIIPSYRLTQNRSYSIPQSLTFPHQIPTIKIPISFIPIFNRFIRHQSNQR
jgi:hypothetical protein